MAVELTEAAKKRVLEQVIEHADGNDWLRLAVRGGGCSGFMYHMEYVNGPGEGDKEFRFDEVKVCVDRKSYLFLNGIVLDFEETLVKSGFLFNNPSASRSCSCGESFTV